MKNLLIMRHAKSDWADSSISDFNRPLNDRGLKAAPFMGKELLKREKVPDMIISSPANRAQTTAKMAAEACKFNHPIVFEHEFYFGSIDKIIDIIKKADNQINTLMLVGHNPTSEALAFMLLKDQNHIQMPTASIVSILFDIEDWRQLNSKTGKLEWIITPKELMK